MPLQHLLITPNLALFGPLFISKLGRKGWAEKGRPKTGPKSDQTFKLNTTELKKAKCDHAIQTRALDLYITSINVIKPGRSVTNSRVKCYKLQGEMLPIMTVEARAKCDQGEVLLIRYTPMSLEASPFYNYQTYRVRILKSLSIIIKVNDGITFISQRGRTIFRTPKG